MLFLTEEDLEKQGVFSKEASQIIFKNKRFTKGSDFSKKTRKAAIAFCQDYLDSQLLCLIVEYQSYLTVWVEEKEAGGTGEIKSPPLYGRYSASTNSSSQVTVQSEESKSFSTNSVQAEAPSDTSVQTELLDFNFVDEPLPTEALPPLAPKDNSSEMPSSIKDKGNFDTPLLSDSPPPPKPSTKKQQTRRYRGISY